MSRWNRPMRRHQAQAVLCLWCGKALKATEVGWTHYGRIRLTDPKWHAAVPAAAAEPTPEEPAP